MKTHHSVIVLPGSVSFVYVKPKHKTVIFKLYCFCFQSLVRRQRRRERRPRFLVDARGSSSVGFALPQIRQKGGAARSPSARGRERLPGGRQSTGRSSDCERTFADCQFKR
jgi:hypothetical protein